MTNDATQKDTYTAKELIAEFEQLKEKYDPAPLDILLGNDSKTRALMESIRLASLISIASELGRIADALEEMNKAKTS